MKKKVEDMTEEELRKMYAEGMADQLGIGAKDLVNSAPVGKWAEKFKDFWKNPIARLKEAIEYHEEMKRKHQSQILRNREVIRKKREMNQRYITFIRNHDRAIRYLRTWIESIKAGEQK